jgi:hypothetical protein
MVATDATHCLYYVKVPNLALHDLDKLASLSTKAMENVQKEHMNTFHKWLLVCDPTLGVEFLQQIQVHYNMNLDPEMMMAKLQFLVSLQVNNE